MPFDGSRLIILRGAASWSQILFRVLGSPDALAWPQGQLMRTQNSMVNLKETERARLEGTVLRVGGPGSSGLWIKGLAFSEEIWKL